MPNLFKKANTSEAVSINGVSFAKSGSENDKNLNRLKSAQTLAWKRKRG